MSQKHRSSSKKAPPEIGLYMECTEENLDPAQVEYYKKVEDDLEKFRSKVDSYVARMNAKLIMKEGEMSLYEVGTLLENQSSRPVSQAVPQSGQTGAYPQVVGQTLFSSPQPGGTYLMMDPRLSLVVSQIPPTPAETPPLQPASVSQRSVQTRTRGQAAAPASAPPASPAPPPSSITTRTRSGKHSKQVDSGVKPATPPPTPPTRTRGADKASKAQAQAQAASPQHSSQASTPTSPVVYSAPTLPTNTGKYLTKRHVKIAAAPPQPGENNAIGGLSCGSKKPWKPNSEQMTSHVADSREVTLNKLSGKTFPSLVVVARPHLRLKAIPQLNVNQERATLDAKVKGVLMYTASKFTEWLIQQGLVRSEQFCPSHVTLEYTPVKLKLGMYSDASKFPYSGGYVWISECCPLQFVSVFSGSIFEGAPFQPTALLKLIYHWACQTNIQNVLQWVKVDNFYVKSFFMNIRAVCTQAVHQKYEKMGGPRRKVEVGVISLGTTSNDGNMREVKVEVLGVMDPESRMIRLKAVEPASDERNFIRRFVKILEPLEEWVHKDSTIVTDYTVDKGTLNSMGYLNVYQVSINDPPGKFSNHNVMEYLRRIVPRMFQNTLPWLSRQIIQQFLDELVWREMWGPIPSQAFVNIVAHIAEQTRMDVTDSLQQRLGKVASNPFKLWNYASWHTPLTGADGKTYTSNRQASPPPWKVGRPRKRQLVEVMTQPIAAPSHSKKSKSMTPKERAKKEEKPKWIEKGKKEKEDAGVGIPEDVMAFINHGTDTFLDSYYYGTKARDPTMLLKGKFKLKLKCVVCLRKFTDNITLMKHMILHHQMEPAINIDLSKVYQCSYCLIGFNTNLAYKAHLEQAHLVEGQDQDTKMFCLICEKKFPNRLQLVYHMQSTHVEMELPYECGICNFRSSVYKKLIDHFMTLHRGSEYMLCPYCLKIVSLSSAGVASESRCYFFVKHLERHQRSGIATKCHRCKLSFIHIDILDQHLEADHISRLSEEGVTAFANNDDTVMMPKPSAMVKLAPYKGSERVVRTRSVHLATPMAVNMTDTDVGDCFECEAHMKPDHFKLLMNCTKCPFSSNCAQAMNEHIHIWHTGPVKEYNIGRSVATSPLHCVCGYSSLSGNKMARHLVGCDMLTAYSSHEKAERAARRLGRARAPSQSVGDPHSVLDTLGLKRKSPEPTIARVDNEIIIIDEEKDTSVRKRKSRGLSSDNELVIHEGGRVAKTFDEPKTKKRKVGRLSLTKDKSAGKESKQGKLSPSHEKFVQEVAEGKNKEETSGAEGKEKEETSVAEVKEKTSVAEGKEKEPTSVAEVKENTSVAEGKEKEPTSVAEVKENTSVAEGKEKEPTSVAEVKEKEETSVAEVKETEETSMVKVNEKEEISVAEVKEKEETSVIEGIVKEESSVAEGKDKEESSVAEGVDKEESSVIEGNDKEESSVIEGKDKEESSVAEGKDKEESSVAEVEDKEDSSVAEGKDKEESSVIEGTDKEEPSETEAKEESSVIEGTDKEESSVAEVEDKEDSSVAEGKDKEESSVIEGTDKEESSVIEGTDKEESSVAKLEDKEESSVVEGKDKEESSVAEVEGKEESSVVEGKDKEESSVAEVEDKEDSSVAEGKDENGKCLVVMKEKEITAVDDKVNEDNKVGEQTEESDGGVAEKEEKYSEEAVDTVADKLAFVTEESKDRTVQVDSDEAMEVDESVIIEPDKETEQGDSPVRENLTEVEKDDKGITDYEEVTQEETDVEKEQNDSDVEVTQEETDIEKEVVEVDKATGDAIKDGKDKMEVTDVEDVEHVNLKVEELDIDDTGVGGDDEDVTQVEKVEPDIAEEESVASEFIQNTSEVEPGAVGGVEGEPDDRGATKTERGDSGVEFHTTNVESGTRDVKPDTTGVELDAAVAQPDTTGVDLEATLAEQDTTGVATEVTVVEPDTTGVAPEVTVPDTTGVAPEVTVTEPDTTGVAPEVTVAEPDTTGVAPEVTVPDTTGVAPEVTVAEPDTTGVAPEASIAEQDVREVEPEATVASPDVKDVEPEATVASPDVKDVEPEAAIASPDVKGLDGSSGSAEQVPAFLCLSAGTMPFCGTADLTHADNTAFFYNSCLEKQAAILVNLIK